VSGVSDYFAEDEFDAIRLARNVVQNLNFKKKTPIPQNLKYEGLLLILMIKNLFMIVKKSWELFNQILEFHLIL
jgi:hypothetical protein